MSYDTPSASWHPAMMPNSIAKAAPRETSPATAPIDIPSKDDADRLEPPNATREIIDDAQDKSVGPDGWFPDYETGASENWLASPKETPAESIDNASALPAQIQHQENEQLPSSTGSKHLSTMSFTRTVSHEVNWTDDEDTEWNLPRTETDPFNFMPPNDRTNSFPVVPVLDSREEASYPDFGNENHLKPLNEETEVHSTGSEALDRGSISGADANDEDGNQPFIGGDLHGTEEEAAEARFTEGVPLIPHEAEEQSLGHETSLQSPDLFGEEDGADGEDDFFAQVGDTARAGANASRGSPLERKSTAQILNGLDFGAGHGAPVLDTPPAEEALESTQDSGADAPLTELSEVENVPMANGEDLDSKWKEMFAGEDEDNFLAEDSGEAKEVDATAFLGSDDEGLLDDPDEGGLEESEQQAQAVPSTPAGQYAATTSRYAPAESQATNGRYLPPSQTANSVQPASNPYLPSPNLAAFEPPAPSSNPIPSSVPPFSSSYAAAPPRPEVNKAQSFADKSKGGYSSPYDLPMEVVKPRKRVSMQQLQRATASATSASTPPPPRSTSFPYSQPPPTGGSGASMSPPSSSHSNYPPASSHKATPMQVSRSRESFFEDLPIASKPRPASRQSNKSLPSPAEPGAYAQPHNVQPHVAPPGAAYHQDDASSTQNLMADVDRLVAPPQVNPYAPLVSGPGHPPSVPAASSNRYSPAPAAQLNGTATLPAVANRYSPAPAGSRSSSGGYTPAGSTPSAPQVLAHQPRTSSPLAHFEITHDRSRALSQTPEQSSADRRTTSIYEARLQRVPSLPPTREVEEDESKLRQFSGETTLPQSASPPDPRYAQPPYRARQTPPPPATNTVQSTLSPPKRLLAGYSPMPTEFAPPPRSHTQSPGALYGNRSPVKSADHPPRPSSVHDPTSPRISGPPAVQSPPSSTFPAAARPRGFSQNLNFIAPTDGTQLDPLQRWKGVPIISWGVGGTIVTTFPKNVPRYGAASSVPMVVRSPGEVKVKNIKDIQPLAERLTKFPGPLKGKNKKKETIAWLNTGLEDLERQLPSMSYQQNVSLEDKRAVERVLLWKILRLFIEHDGVLEGIPAVEQAVRDVLSPGSANGELALSPAYAAGAALPGISLSSVTQMQSDSVDSSSMEEIRNHLMLGDREKAVWVAADRRLWGHAMLLANTTSLDLYKKVAQEFVKKEVNFPGHQNESLGALYAVLSGNHEESVDELVPSHARAGLQLIATNNAQGQSKDAMEGLEKWRETLGLILSNRSAEDTRAINALGNLLSGYGRAEAAHICFLFARNVTVFGGLDDPASNFVLVGSDHKRQTEQFATEIEPLLLSEVYEYGLSLAGGSNVAVTSPHLAAYKYQHALALAEYGYRDRALQYCESIASAITSQTRRSPYHHAILEAAVEDLMKRLKQAPKDESSSWIKPPSMNKVSDSLFSRFNKFVAGDDDDNLSQGLPAEGAEAGPFARVSSGTPTISRPPSASNFDTFNANIPSYGLANGPIAPAPAPVAATRAASRYAPMAPQAQVAPTNHYEPVASSYAPYSSSDRTSSELNRSSLELQTGYMNGTAAGHPYSPAQGYQPHQAAGLGLTQGSPYLPASQPGPDSTDLRTHSAHSHTEPLNEAKPAMNGSSYQPYMRSAEHQNTESANVALVEPGYQAPSYGFEPPSLTPYEDPAKPSEEAQDGTANGGYEPPSYEPYSYEPPSYQPADDADREAEDAGMDPKPKNGPEQYGDENDFGTARPSEKTKEEKDRENAEMFRKAAEEDERRSAEQKAAKKGWGFGGWFGGATPAKKEAVPEPAGPSNKPIRAKLGEANSFYYDPEQKRWINKAGGAEAAEPKKATPPPPRAGGPSRSANSSPAPPAAGPSSSVGLSGRPPAGPPRALRPAASTIGLVQQAAASASDSNLSVPPTMMMRSASNTSMGSVGGPPSRPATSMSNASSIDDLLAAPGGASKAARGAKKPRKSGRYVDVMAKP